MHPLDPDALRHLPLFRARADELRASQEGQAWSELRGMVARLLGRLIAEQGTQLRMVDRRPGIGIAACIPFSDNEAALRVEDGIFWISSAAPWTALRAAGTWRVPPDPTVVLIYANAPPGTTLH